MNRIQFKKFDAIELIYDMSPTWTFQESYTLIFLNLTFTLNLFIALFCSIPKNIYIFLFNMSEHKEVGVSPPSDLKNNDTIFGA